MGCNYPSMPSLHNNGLVQLLLKLWYGWVIKSHMKQWLWLLTHTLILFKPWSWCLNIPWLLMTWFLTSPGHQQYCCLCMPWLPQGRLHKYLSRMTECSSILYVSWNKYAHKRSSWQIKTTLHYKRKHFESASISHFSTLLKCVRICSNIVQKMLICVQKMCLNI